MEQKQFLLFIIVFPVFAGMAASSSIPASFSDRFSGKLRRILSELLRLKRNNMALLPEKEESLEGFSAVEDTRIEDLKNAWKKNMIGRKERRLKDLIQNVKRNKPILRKNIQKIVTLHDTDSTQNDAKVGRPPFRCGRCRAISGGCIRCRRQFSDKFASAFETKEDQSWIINNDRRSKLKQLFEKLR